LIPAKRRLKAPSLLVPIRGFCGYADRMTRAAAATIILFSCIFTPLHAVDSPALDLARQLNNAFIEVADRVSPSVVVIKVQERETEFDLDENSPFWEMVPKEFRRRLQEEREKERENSREPKSNPMPRRHPPIYNGRGSGIILREDGYIMTNCHVVEDAEKISVRLHDGRTFSATVQGTDPQSDIAVIKIAATNLPAAKLGDSRAVRVGEFAIAIGAPFDLDYSVTYGHISGKGRSYVVPALSINAPGATMDQDFIQTDASINPGNSGGPLVNLYGEVVGINTLIRGLSTGIGFAVPINLARDVATKLIVEGKFSRAWLGIGIRALREDEDHRDLGHGLTDGVIVTQIRPDGPALNSDLRAGDIITAVDGRAVATENELRSEVRAKAATNVVLDIVRVDDRKKARNLKVTVRPEPWPEKPKVAASRKADDSLAAPPQLGFTTSEFTAELKSKYDIEEEGSAGVVVTDVSSDGVAWRKLRAGDVITAINHRPIKTAAEFTAAIGKADLKRGILLDIVNHGTKRVEVLRAAE
jgi:serine protease Do